MRVRYYVDVLVCVRHKFVPGYFACHLKLSCLESLDPKMGIILPVFNMYS